MFMFRHLFYLITIMLMYFIESIFIGFFINLAWKYVLYSTFNIEILYFQWVLITWIIKILFFDILKNYQVTDINNKMNDNNN